MANNVVLDNRYYQNIDQSDSACFYLPDIPLGQPVVLPGQCNQNIPVVQNFDVARVSITSGFSLPFCIDLFRLPKMTNFTLVDTATNWNLKEK